jgi:Na+/H+-dicarboxylate symporter
VSTSSNETSKRGHGLGLLAILAGIVLGVGFGGVYGRQMWLASGGPQQRLERLEKTIEQKRRFRREASDKADKLDQQAQKKADDGLGEQAQALWTEAQRFRDRAERLQGHIDREGGILDAIRQTEGLLAEAQQTDLRVAKHVSQLVRFCGDVFLRALMLIVIPLVVTTMICGITSLGDIRQMGKIGGWTLFYYLATGAVAVTLGIVLVTIIRPGAATDDTFAYLSENIANRQETTVLDTLLEVVRGREDDAGSGMIPSNIFLAASKTNVLALILFSLLLGGALSTLGQRGRAAVEFFQAANDAVMKIVHLIIFFAPVGIFGLIATRIADAGGAAAFGSELARLGRFVLTVSLGLAIHLVVLCAVLAVFARRNPLKYLYAMARALLTAVSTDSSSATLPVTMECVGDAGVSERSAGFVLPLGATINMDGTALYEATAAIFIAQSAGVPLSGAALLVVFLTATLAAIGAPGIPEAGLVTLLIVLAAVGLPASGIGTILAIDWFLDRQRTSINVFGDAVGAAVIDRYFGRSRQ